MNTVANTPIGKTIRIQLLRRMVSLADSTIYEMGTARGISPPRFCLDLTMCATHFINSNRIMANAAGFSIGGRCPQSGIT
jgi:hypothetical protein